MSKKFESKFQKKTLLLEIVYGAFLTISFKYIDRFPKRLENFPKWWGLQLALKCVKFTTASGEWSGGYFGFTAKSIEGVILSEGNFYFSKTFLQKSQAFQNKTKK